MASRTSQSRLSVNAGNNSQDLLTKFSDLAFSAATAAGKITQRGVTMAGGVMTTGIDAVGLKDKVEAAESMARKLAAKGKSDANKAVNKARRMANRALEMDDEEDLMASHDYDVLLSCAGAVEKKIAGYSSHTVAVTLPAGSRLIWKARVKKFDIGFTVREMRETGSGSSVPIVIEPPQRYNADAWMKGEVPEANRQRTINIVFDNTHTALQRKMVVYLIQMGENISLADSQVNVALTKEMNAADRGPPDYTTFTAACRPRLPAPNNTSSDARKKQARAAIEEGEWKAMKEDHSYTEFERAAAEWRRQQQLSRSVATNSSTRESSRHSAEDKRRSSRERSRDRHHRKESRHHRSRERERSRDRRRSRSRDRSRDRDRHSHRSRQQDAAGTNRGGDRYAGDGRDTVQAGSASLRDSPSSVPEVDEFGRIVPPGKKVVPAPSRRSRSRSRSQDSNNGRSRDRHRSRSRSRSRSGKDEKWVHDKFASVADVSPIRGVPSDYRPPSPEWISKAGGVAIMRKKPKS